MENKNTIFAIVLCLAIMFGWAPLAEHMGWMKPIKQEQLAQEQQQQAAEQQKAQEIAAKEAEQARLLPAFTPSAGRDVTVETPLFKASLYSGGAILRSLKKKKYQYYLLKMRVNLIKKLLIVSRIVLVQGSLKDYKA